MLPLAGGWGLQQELEAAAGCKAQQPHLEGQENVAIHLKFLKRESTSHPLRRIHSPLVGENSTWRQSRAAQGRLGSFLLWKRPRQVKPPSPASQSHPGWGGAGAVGGQAGIISSCKTHSCVLLPLISPPSAAMSNVSWHRVPHAGRCPDGGREGWRTLLVLPEVLKSTGTTHSREGSLLRAGPCTTMKGFSCQ